MRRIPGAYRKEALDHHGAGSASTETDCHCLANWKHYRSLMPMAQKARKPIFHLKAAHGALGGHIHAVLDCRDDLQAQAETIAARREVEW